jgi:hypothetical protein
MLSTASPAPPTHPPSAPVALLESPESRTTPPNPLLLFNAASHAERNPDGLAQLSRSLTKFTDAQKATRKIRQETERRAQDLLSQDLDQLLTEHREELEDLAQRHGKKVEAIDKIIASGHYKKKRSVSIENAKTHMKSLEVNAGKSSSLLLILHDTKHLH